MLNLMSQIFKEQNYRHALLWINQMGVYISILLLKLLFAFFDLQNISIGEFRPTNLPSDTVHLMQTNHLYNYTQKKI